VPAARGDRYRLRAEADRADLSWGLAVTHVEGVAVAEASEIPLAPAPDIAGLQHAGVLVAGGRALEHAAALAWLGRRTVGLRTRGQRDADDEEDAAEEQEQCRATRSGQSAGGQLGPLDLRQGCHVHGRLQRQVQSWSGPAQKVNGTYDVTVGETVGEAVVETVPLARTHSALGRRSTCLPAAAWT